PIAEVIRSTSVRQEPPGTAGTPRDDPTIEVRTPRATVARTCRPAEECIMSGRSAFMRVMVAGALALAAGSFGGGHSSGGTATVRMRMTKAPAALDQVNIVVNEVAVLMGNESDATSDWVVINSSPQTYNLLALQGGVFATIGQSTVKAGHYSQIRLKIGTG